MITALLIYLIPLIILVALIKLLIDFIRGLVRCFKKD